MLKGNRIKLVLILGVIGALAVGGWAMAQLILGLGEYPGGTLREVYTITHGGVDYPPTTYTVEIAPNGDRFDITELIESPGRPADAVGTGFGTSGAARGVGTQYKEGDEEEIDLSPLAVLEEREVTIEPNQSYLLPDGALLETGELSQIAGVEVIMATYTHPRYPTQRIQLALPVDREIAKLLVYPPLFVKEREGEMVRRVELVEFSHTP